MSKMFNRAERDLGRAIGKCGNTKAARTVSGLDG
jgi:hypothetical protein